MITQRKRRASRAVPAYVVCTVLVSAASFVTSSVSGEGRKEEFCKKRKRKRSGEAD
jgi:peptidoglycan/LPS O-acetylase OafA/YrhL